MRCGSAKHPEGLWLARSTRVYSPAPPTPACPGFEENALELDGFQDAGSAWAVATVGAEVKWCFEGGWLRKAGGRQPVCGEGRVVRGAHSSSLVGWYGGWLGYWACQKFQAFEIMLATEEPMHDLQFFSRWHNLSGLYPVK